jgi:hypothetical protein
MSIFSLCWNFVTLSYEFITQNTCNSFNKSILLENAVFQRYFER